MSVIAMEMIKRKCRDNGYEVSVYDVLLELKNEFPYKNNTYVYREQNTGNCPYEAMVQKIPF